MSAESFHRHVGVVCVIWWSRLLYVTVGRVTVKSFVTLHRAEKCSPPGDDDLLPSEEIDAVRAVHVKVAVERSLPSTERKEGERLRDGHVDASHAGFDPLAELP